MWFLKTFGRFIIQFSSLTVLNSNISASAITAQRENLCFPFEHLLWFERITL